MDSTQVRAKAAKLKVEPLAGFVVDLVSLPAGSGEILSRGFVAVAKQNHRFVVGIGPFVKLMSRDTDNLALRQLMANVAPFLKFRACPELSSDLITFRERGHAGTAASEFTPGAEPLLIRSCRARGE
jgi:hypothetical protein